MQRAVMADIRAVIFIAVTLLKWCNTEIASTVPESWYSANVIRDGTFSPKSISEIFSTEDTFSTINPIIVLPTSNSLPPNPLFNSLQTSLNPFTGSTLPPTLINRDPTTLQTFPTTSSPYSSLQTFPTTSSPFSSLQTFPTTSSPLSSLQTFPTTSSPLSSLQTFPTTSSPLSSLQTFPTSPPTFSSSLSSFTPVTSTFAPTRLTSPSPQVPNIQTVQTFPPGPTNPPNIQYILCGNCQQPTQSSPATAPVSPTSFPLSVTPTPSVSTFVQTNPTPAPCATNAPFRVNSTIRGYPFIRIRMFSNKGATPVTRSTTPRTTTTRRPRRNRKNNYDACVNACGGGRNQICAAPLATRPVDPNALRGFPSICHMACYNSFKKIQYEKLVDGRCGRLRTRIRPVDSKNKIRQNDLNKAQYQIVSGADPLTVIEVQSKK